MLAVQNLKVNAPSGEEILKGIDLTLRAGEVHAIMGPNGSGKSTFAKVLAGYPGYEVTSGTVGYEINARSQDLFELSPDERAKEGVFLAFQYPVEVPGVGNFALLKESVNAVLEHQGAPPMEDGPLRAYIEEKARIMEVPTSFLDRGVNVGFSGGEKKKNEILQMALLNPRLALLDETDSGLDIDSLKTVAHGINSLRSAHNAFLLVTHYQRLLDLVVPDYVHVMVDGKLVESGGAELALKLEEQGYESWRLH